MDVVYIAPECSPFTAISDLSNIVPSLSKSIEKEGHKVCIFMPRYGCIEPSLFQIERIPAEFKVKVEGVLIPTMVYKGILPNSFVSIFFIESQSFFSNSREVYLDWSLDKERFKFFSLACVEIISKLKIKPDTVHLFGPRVASIASLLNKNVKPVFTVDNLSRLAPDLVESTKEAISLSSFVTTVSRTYGQELLLDSEYREPLLSKKEQFIGMLHSLDNDEYNPESNPSIPQTYSKNYFTLGKRKCKEDLLDFLGFQKNMQLPLFLVFLNHPGENTTEIINTLSLISHQNLQLLVLSFTKEQQFHELNKITSKYKNIKLCPGFDHPLQKKCFAGADFFLGLNKQEPSGLHTLIAMEFGTVPVCYRCGAIKEIIIDVDSNNEGANGITYRDYDKDEILEAMSKAIRCFKSKEIWPRLVKQAMSTSSKITNPAKEYVSYYNQLVKTTANVFQ